MSKKVPQSSRISVEVKEAMQEYAKDCDRSESWVIEKALREFLFGKSAKPPQK